MKEVKKGPEKRNDHFNRKEDEGRTESHKFQHSFDFWRGPSAWETVSIFNERRVVELELLDVSATWMTNRVSSVSFCWSRWGVEKEENRRVILHHHPLDVWTPIVKSMSIHKEIRTNAIYLHKSTRSRPFSTLCSCRAIVTGVSGRRILAWHFFECRVFISYLHRKISLPTVDGASGWRVVVVAREWQIKRNINPPTYRRVLYILYLLFSSAGWPLPLSRCYVHQDIRGEEEEDK